MIKIPGRIPIIIHPTFWILCGFIAFLNSQGNWLHMVMWVGIIFISVLVHELGHALTALFFGRKPHIEFVALGGVTYHDSQKLKPWKRFLITLNGPVFGLLLALVATILLSIPAFLQHPPLVMIARWFLFVNIFWTLVNLLPVVPLDGGQLLQIVLEKIFGLKGIRYGYFASMVIAVLLSLVSFLYQSFLAGAFFFLFAYQGYEAWKQAKMMTPSDEKESLRTLFEEGEKALQRGKKGEAQHLFEKVREEAPQGILGTLSAQYLSALNYEAKRVSQAYDLLLPLRGQVSGEGLSLLHLLAYEMKDYSLVKELAGVAYQSQPTIETALRNASAAAVMGEVEAAIGWLETAHQEGLENVKEVVEGAAFSRVKMTPAFQAFLARFSTH